MLMYSNRTFEPGRAEVIVGRGFVGRMQNTCIGDRLRFGQRVTRMASAIFGAINTMDAMVAARGCEIALLRTLGFRRRSIKTSFLAESLLVALAGILGVLFALPINGIQTSTTNWQPFSEITFALRVTPGA